mgnify:CR=1 FL=1
MAIIRTPVIRSRPFVVSDDEPLEAAVALYHKAPSQRATSHDSWCSDKVRASSLTHKETHEEAEINLAQSRPSHREEQACN